MKRCVSKEQLDELGNVSRNARWGQLTLGQKALFAQLGKIIWENSRLRVRFALAQTYRCGLCRHAFKEPLYCIWDGKLSGEHLFHLSGTHGVAPEDMVTIFETIERSLIANDNTNNKKPE